MPVVMNSFIVPVSTALPYLIEDKYVKGGLRFVATEVERDAIHSFARREGMLVYVKETKKYYQLGADLTTWSKASLGGSDQVFEFSAPIKTDLVDGKTVISLASGQVIPSSPGAGYALVSGDKQTLIWLDMFGQQSRGTRNTVQFEASALILPGAHEDFELSLSATAILLDVELSAFDVELTGWRDSTRSELNPYTFVSTQDMLSDQGVSVVDDEYVKHRRFAILASATGGSTHYFRFTNLGSTPCKPKVTITYLALQ